MRLGSEALSRRPTVLWASSKIARSKVTPARLAVPPALLARADEVIE
jgi:hypothetical protein